MSIDEKEYNANKRKKMSRLQTSSCSVEEAKKKLQEGTRRRNAMQIIVNPTT